jgi:predicted Fe-Mo cluster-binding NifX family protein
MMFAVPLANDLKLYRQNPCTAPKFGIYTVDGEPSNVSFMRLRIMDNPWLKNSCEGFEGEQINCNCASDQQKSFRHKTEHYAILEAIAGCSFLLANNYCKNTLQTLKNGGIKIYEIPNIITNIDSAIKNFLVGAYLARSIKHIHHDA